MSKKNSILFVRPDYHCSFFYRDEFRKQGWKADIYVPADYPENLLYSGQDILSPPVLPGKKTRVKAVLNKFMMFLWWHTIFWKYDTHLYYGHPPIIRLGKILDHILLFSRIVGRDFCWELWIAKLLGINLIFLPTGCLDSDLKQTFQTFDDGNVCNNCGFFDKCDDKVNARSFNRIRKYFDFAVGGDTKFSKEMIEKPLKYKAIDLHLWDPDMEIPAEHRLPPTQNLRILHSAYLDKSDRTWKGRNIKGSPYVVAAIEQLQAEGYPVEYLYISNKPSNQMRFYQAQADIVVEQLIYGWWGSTGVETMTLGKPVVCYLRPSWKEHFLSVFPEYTNVPVINASTTTIYEELKKVVVDADYRKQKGEESRRFAEQHFDPAKNTRAFIQILEKL
jgi:hypothetical protein